MSAATRNAWSRVGWPCLAGLLLLLGRPTTAQAGTEDGAERARKILNAWVTAMGGVDAIRELTSADYDCDIRFRPDQPAVRTYIQATAAGRYRYEYQLPARGLLVQAFNGKVAWESNDTLGFGLLTPAEHEQNLAGVDFRAPIKVGHDFASWRALPDETVAGRRLQVIELVDRSGAKVNWFFDPASGLRVRIEGPGSAGHVVIDYSDFRTVHDVQEPFHFEEKVGTTTLELTMRSILFNGGEKPELFTPPPFLVEQYEEAERLFQVNAKVCGLAALRHVRTRVTEALTEITTSNLKVPTTIIQKRPNLLVIKEEVPGVGLMWRGFDGRIGWAWNELAGYRTMQGAELMQLEGTADLEGPLHLRNLCPLRKLLPEREDHGGWQPGVALATLAGPAGNFYFDAASGHLVRVETLVQAGPSGELKIVAEFSDFRNVDGVTMPFVTAITNPAVKSVTTITSIKENVPLDDALFTPRKDE